MSFAGKDGQSLFRESVARPSPVVALGRLVRQRPAGISSESAGTFRFNGRFARHSPAEYSATFSQVKPRVGGGTRHNAVHASDAYPAWGSPHVGAKIDGSAVREVGTAELWLPAA
jgi:hypothetical protein